MYIYACIYIYIYICIYIYLYEYLNMNTGSVMFSCMHSDVGGRRAFVCFDVHMYVYMGVCRCT